MKRTPGELSASKKEALVKTWSKTFPDELDTENDSKSFVHRFIIIATSYVLEKRNILPESSFTKRFIGKFVLPVLNGENEQGKRLRKKLEGLKKAIEDKVLDEFALVFYRKPDEEDVFEAFTFKLQYWKDGSTSVRFQSGSAVDGFDYKYEGIDGAKQNFFKTLRTMHSYMKNCLADLPDNSEGSFRASFTENTPNDYVIDGFEIVDNFYEMPQDHKLFPITAIGGAHHSVNVAYSSTLSNGNFDFSYDSCNTSLVRKPARSPIKRIDKSKTRKYAHSDEMINQTNRQPADFSSV